MNRTEFIESVAKYAAKIAPKYGLPFISPIIAQACKESAFGVSDKVIFNGVYMHNYFGLKFKGYDRVPIAIGAFNAATKEEYVKGILTNVPDASWYMFNSLEDCVEGYCQFLVNAPNNRYASLFSAMSPYDYCKKIHESGYATGSNYSESLFYDYIEKYNLEQYDKLLEGEKMKFTNSPLVDFTQISPCKSARKYAIDSIVIHCYVGQVSVERMGKGWANLTANASANYGIGTDGRIGLYVDEKDRAWTTGGKWAVNGITGAEYDHRAVTIECACDTTAPYAINDKVMSSLIKLCADICQRNGISALLWKGDKNLVGDVRQQNLAVHRWFTSKSCPGDYIYNRLFQIVSDVNELLGGKKPLTNDTIIYHTVASGETLSKIASVYGVAWQDIATANGIKDPKKLQKGAVLKIFVDGKNVPATYTVVSGDNLTKIASKVGITLDTLKKLNPQVKAPFYIIRVGQTLKIK